MCRNLKPADCCGSMYRWWKPIGTLITSSMMKAMRAISSLNRRPPAIFGRMVYIAIYAGNSQKYTIACSVQENSVRARPGSIVLMMPSDQGISWNSISIATPALVHSHMIALAVVPYIARGTISPGLSRFHRTVDMIISRHQIQEPTTSSVAPM